MLTGTTALAVALLVARSEAGPAPHVASHDMLARAAEPSLTAPEVAALAAAPFAASTMPPPLIYGRARMVHAPTPCDVPTFSEGGPGAPYFVANGLPQAGEPFRVDWTTKPTSPGESPAWPAMLLIALDPMAPMSLASLGAPGCHLLVQPDFIMMPEPGSILTQFGGCVSLDWTPRVGLVGFEFYSQLLCTAPSVNTGGFLVSPALHVQVGL